MRIEKGTLSKQHSFPPWIQPCKGSSSSLICSIEIQCKMIISFFLLGVERELFSLFNHWEDLVPLSSPFLVIIFNYSPFLSPLIFSFYFLPALFHTLLLTIATVLSFLLTLFLKTPLPFSCCQRGWGGVGWCVLHPNRLNLSLFLSVRVWLLKPWRLGFLVNDGMWFNLLSSTALHEFLWAILCKLAIVWKWWTCSDNW